MKLKEIVKEACSKKMKKEEEEFTKVVASDYKKWVETLVDMVEGEGMDFEEALDSMLDNDPKFEALSQAQQRVLVRAIRKKYYDSIH